MNVLGISETSENNNDSFLNNVSLDGYKIFHTPTNSSKGGVALFVNREFDTFERVDLKVQQDNLHGPRITYNNYNFEKMAKNPQKWLFLIKNCL